MRPFLFSSLYSFLCSSLCSFLKTWVSKAFLVGQKYINARLLLKLYDQRKLESKFVLHMKLFCFYGCISCGVLACSSQSEPPEAPPPQVFHQAFLEQLFDRAVSQHEAERLSATREIVQLPSDDLELIRALWGTRSQDCHLAKHIGDAFLEAQKKEMSLSKERKKLFLILEARFWYRQALLHSDASESFVFLGQLRYDLALTYYLEGRYEPAIELLVNRLDSRPFSQELEEKYQTLLEKIAHAP